MRTLAVFCAVSLIFGLATVQAEQCKLEISTPKPVLSAGKKQTTCVKVGIKGFEMKSEKERAPLNISLVIDRSGSMTGRKIERAKQAAIQALQRLDSRDIVSIVVFDDKVDILVPATKITNLQSVEEKIKSIRPGGSTALYEGTKAGAAEVKKFLEKGQVNRVVLLSDGQANVGPSSVDELGQLGSALGESGISVTTFGLGDGYNEDLMAKLSKNSDGNHAFIEDADELTDIFQKEFNTALSVVAQEVACVVTLPKGIRPVRSLNMDVDIKGQEVTFGWNQIYSNHERFVMLEVEVPATKDGQSRELAKATLSYTNMQTKELDKLSGKIDVKFSASEARVKEQVDKPVMEEYVELIANLENKRAMKLRDEGKVKEAQAAFAGNAAFLDSNSDNLGGSERLKRSAGMNRSQSSAAGSSSGWGGSRKGMVKEQLKADMQLGY